MQWLFHPLMEIIPIQLGRLHFLQPLAWYVAMAIGLVLIARQGLIGKVIAFGAILLQTYILFGAFEGTLHRRDPSFRGFYAESLFDQVKEELGNPAGYRVLSVGMHPSIAQYNGFYTLDGYMVDYPLTYKHQFKKLIQGELDKAPALDHYYTHLGFACLWIFSGTGT